MKKSYVIGGFCVLILIIAGLVAYIIFGNKGGSDNPKNDGTQENEVNQGGLNSGNEFDIAIEDQYDDALTQYFGLDYLALYNYENLARYPAAYKDVIIRVDASVKKVIEEQDNHYKILVDMFDYFSMYDEQEIVIEGDYKKARYLVNDDIRVYGVYKGNETFNIDGTTKVLPKIEAIKVVFGNVDGDYQEFDEDDIRKVASEFFESTYTLTKPNYDFTSELGLYYASLPFHYIITVDNNTNARFNKYRMYTGSGRIDVATEEDSMYLKRYISKTSDRKNFILSTYTTNNDFLELQAYNKDFKPIWSRQFENAGKYIYDNNNGRIALSIDNDLYIIDEKTGENVLDPIMTSKGTTIKLLSNGDIILVTDSMKDFIFYIDSKGNIKWRKSLSTYNGEADNKVDGAYSILVANQKIYVGYYRNNFSDANVAVFDESGEELVNTFANPNN